MASSRSTIQCGSTSRSCRRRPQRSPSGRCCSTPAGCATGATSSPWPAGRAAARVHTHEHVLDVLSPAGAQLRAGHALVLQQFGLQPGGDPGLASEWHVVRGVHQGAHLRSAGHDGLVLARRLDASREAAGRRLRRAPRGVRHEHALRERPRQRRHADDDRRSPQVERELRDARGRRRGARSRRCSTRGVQRRPRARVCPRALRGHLPRRPRGRSQRRHGRLRHAPRSLSRPARVGRRALQRQHRVADELRQGRSRAVSRRSRRSRRRRTRRTRLLRRRANGSPGSIVRHSRSVSSGSRPTRTACRSAASDASSPRPRRGS